MWLVLGSSLDGPILALFFVVVSSVQPLVEREVGLSFLEGRLPLEESAVPLRSVKIALFIAFFDIFVVRLRTRR